MICKNPHCQTGKFAAVVEMDDNRVIGLKCMCCGARYSMRDIQIKPSLKRKGWNVVLWYLR